ncbi:MAG: hypothetical protein IT320_17780 [Anaerolineae bacterium]|jgi:hypothetical protein|nr:hypothetical protein [Anaerolineae bacterium]
MSYLTEVFPPARVVVRRLPGTRDQVMLLLAAITELFLGIDIYFAHSISGTIKTNEWIPIVFGIAAGIILLLAGLIAFRNRPLATVLANVVFLGSIVVGLLGAYFHLVRANLIGGGTPIADTVSVLIWAPPFLGPLFFALNGVLGISAAWIEDPVNSGRLRLLGSTHVQMPYSKTRAYFFIVSVGLLATTISSVLDHARINLENPWVWIPTVAGIFAVVVSAALGLIRRPSRSDLTIYTVTMVLMCLVGVVGFVLHVNTNLIANGTILMERFVRGSPFLAPLVFANWGLIGLVALLDPREERLA